MNRCLAVLMSVLLLATSVLPVSAAGNYNDDEFNWGEYACTHSTTKTVAAVPSTCTTPGHAAYTRCTACGVVTAGSDAELPLAEHTYDNACDGDCNVCGAVRETTHDYRDTVIIPDCENSGYIIHTCTVCGDSYVDGRVDALGHHYQLSEDVTPTCVVDGKKVYVCRNCGDSYTEIVPATGKHIYEYPCDEDCNECGYVRDDAHSYIFMGTVEPTCGEDGSDGYKCWNCGSVKYVVIPATGKHTYSGLCDADCNVCGQHREDAAQHDYRLTATVEVTCITDGKHTYTCIGCGDSYSDIIVAQGHKYDIVITKPDCENGGYTTHTCSVCGYSCVDNRVPALGHTAGPAADCENAQSCTVCGVVLNAALGHKYQSVVTAPDCVNDGYTTYTCANCGDSYVADGVDALGHTAGPAADCKNDQICTVCGVVLDLALGHDYKAVVTVPDCVNGGYTTYTCSVCGDSYVADKTDMLGHNYVPLSAEPPACDKEGFERYYCTNCGDSYKVVVEATGHSYEAVVTAPDCVNGGYTTYTCATCGDSYVADRVDALGHTAVVLPGYAATCETDGLTSGIVCSVCGYVKTAQTVIPAPGHSYDDDFDTDCNVCGAVREPLRVPGDANGDGAVNNRDLALMQQHINKWNVVIDPDAADVNDDGAVNNRDLALLQQYINKWDVVLK